MASFHPSMAAHPAMPPGQPMGHMNPHAAGPPMGHMQGQGMPAQMHPMPGPNPVSQGGQMVGGMPHGMNPGVNAMAHLQTGPQVFPNQQMPPMSQQHMLAQQHQAEQMARTQALINRQQQNPMGMMKTGQGQAGPTTGPGQQQQQLRGPPQMPGMHPQQPGPNSQPGAGGPTPQMRSSSSQGLQAPPGQAQQAQQAQQGQQQPQRPQMPARQPTNHSSPAQNSQQNQQASQSQPQQETPAATAGPQASANGSQDGQSRGPQQQQQQQASQQQHQQQSGQQQGGQQQGPQQGPQPNAEMQKQMMYQRALRNNANLQMSSQVSELMTQSAKIRLVLFAEQLGSITSDNMRPPIESLQQMVSEYFVEHGTFQIKMTDTGSEFSVPMATLARFFSAQYESGVQNIQLSVFRAQVRTKGRLRVIMSLQHQKFESFFFESMGNDEFIKSEPLRSKLQNHSPENQLKSPLMNKNNKNAGKLKGKNNPGATRTAIITDSDFPAIDVRSDGLTHAAHRFLQMTTMVSQMQNLVDYAQSNKIMSAGEALAKYNEAHQAGQVPQQPMGPGFPGPQGAAGAAQQPPFSFMGMAPNGFPGGPNVAGMRPNPAGMNSQFPSPAGNHLGLPNNMNSPHMRQGGSPGQPGMHAHMQGQVPMAPQMSAQASMQGTNSGAPSSNASPSAPNKKRRQSQVKLDGQNDPGGAPTMNGVVPNPQKVTPKMPNQTKRPRAN
ncbi:MAG: hypothetical protein Q9162_000551 [Coniocarpon cinnabarinum]